MPGSPAFLGGHMEKIPLKIVVDDGIEAPKYAKPGDAGIDLRSAIDIWMRPGQIFNVPTGVKVAIPEGYVGDVRPRSGLASKHGITVINSPGTIDSGYRGVIGVPLVNLGKKPFAISKGDRIAQLVIAPIAVCDIEIVDELDETERGEGGFGSSGLN